MSINRKQLKKIAKQETKKTIKENKELIPEQQAPPDMAGQVMQAVGPALEQVQQLFAQGQQAAEIGNQMVGTAETTQQALMQVMGMLQQQQAMEAEQTQMQAKAEKHEARTQSQVAENVDVTAEELIKAVKDSALIEQETLASSNLSRVYRVEIKVVIDRDMNFKDLFNSIRAIEGVTVVSTDADSQNISPTLQRGLLSIKFLKGARSAEYYLRLLNQAIKRLKGIKSTSLGTVNIVRDA